MSDDDLIPGHDLEYWAWTIIANVSGGDWSQQSNEWCKAASEWRDAFHAALSGEGGGAVVREADRNRPSAEAKVSRNPIIPELRHPY